MNVVVSAAPPSLPVCQWDGDIDMGGSVTLSCSVAEGVPTPEIRWDKLNPEEIALPINMEGQWDTHKHTHFYLAPCLLNAQILQTTYLQFELQAFK